MLHYTLCVYIGIYVGKGMVIHFTRGSSQETETRTMLGGFYLSSPHHASRDTPCPKCGYQTKTEGVTQTCLDCFLYGGYLYLFEYGVSPAFFLAKARGGTCTIASSDSTDRSHPSPCFLSSQERIWWLPFIQEQL
ncbi:hypothetical protein D0Y65_030720 [Glycine soja]|uniref:LRAT domain-containing protein n=1 Tax=Glycine soja TaxID=3848 RepID=A0A445I516_GLYSO|nr:hypothetical protein D0Y65_030720 [Glycine soja]RZB81094.1 hypothetical protein D0Y65_030720 [Glycine soja]